MDAKDVKKAVHFNVSITRLYQGPRTKKYGKVNHGLRAIYRVRNLQIGKISGQIQQSDTVITTFHHAELMHKHRKVRTFDVRTIEGINDRKTLKDVDPNFRRLPSKFNKLEQKPSKVEEKEEEKEVNAVIVEDEDIEATVNEEMMKQVKVQFIEDFNKITEKATPKPKRKRPTKKRAKPPKKPNNFDYI